MAAVETFETTGAARTIVLRGRVMKKCPFVDELDIGWVEVRYRAYSRLLEIHSFARYLRSLAQHELSHEDLAALIREDVQASLRDEDGSYRVNVAVTFETSGITAEVTCP